MWAAQVESTNSKLSSLQYFEHRLQTSDRHWDTLIHKASEAYDVNLEIPIEAIPCGIWHGIPCLVAFVECEPRDAFAEWCTVAYARDHLLVSSYKGPIVWRCDECGRAVFVAGRQYDIAHLINTDTFVCLHCLEDRRVDVVDIHMQMDVPIPIYVPVFLDTFKERGLKELSHVPVPWNVALRKWKEAHETRAVVIVASIEDDTLLNDTAPLSFMLYASVDHRVPAEFGDNGIGVCMDEHPPSLKSVIRRRAPDAEAAEFATKICQLMEETKKWWAFVESPGIGFGILCSPKSGEHWWVTESPVRNTRRILLCTKLGQNVFNCIS